MPPSLRISDEASTICELLGAPVRVTPRSARVRGERCVNADRIVPLRTIVEITTPRNRASARLRCGPERACERPGVAAPERGSGAAPRPAMSAAACFLAAAVALLLGLACGLALGRHSRASARRGGPGAA